MFDKTKKISKIAVSQMNSDVGNRNGGSGFTDFISVKNLKKWKPSVGVNKIDVIPYNASASHPLVKSGQVEEGDTLYVLEVYVHKGVGPSNSNYVCLKQFGHRCPMCEESSRLHNVGTPESDEQASNLYAKRRIVYVVHDLMKDEYGFWDTGFKGVQQKINSLSQFEVDDNGAKVDIFDWEEGRTIQFIGTESTFNGNKYVDVDGFNFAKREPLSDEVLSHSLDLSTCLNVVDEESMEKIISGECVVSNPTVTKPQDETYSAVDSISQMASQAVESPVEKSSNVSTTESASGNCPYGHNWREADHHPECATCQLWEKCAL